MSKTTGVHSSVVQSLDGDNDLSPDMLMYTKLRQEYLSGVMPHASRRRVETEAPLSIFDLAPPADDYKQIYSSKPGTSSTYYYEERDHKAAVIIQLFPGYFADITAVSTHSWVATSLVADFVRSVPIQEAPPSDVVRYKLWSAGAMGPNCNSRNIQCDAWDDIRRNYPGPSLSELDRLMTMEAPTNSNVGKLILWHGKPGTGKTTAIRAMTREWKDWCEPSYITDPEALFGDPNYLLSIAARESSSKWQLLIAEDSDQFLREESAGPALGRLLNFSDGILGQGAKTLVLITTNENVQRMHPAVIRPGRCLSSLEFKLFTHEEARGWFGDDALPDSQDRWSLAELIELKDQELAKV